MTTYIQNYGIAKTLYKENNKKHKNSLKWLGEYNGKDANIQLEIEDDGHKDFKKIHLDNNEIMDLLGVHPVEVPIDQRLNNDFLLSHMPMFNETIIYDVSSK